MKKFLCCEVCSPEGLLVGVDDCPGNGACWNAGAEKECLDCPLAIWEEIPRKEKKLD